jgi:hypothetical protein
VSEWTVDTLKEHYDTLLSERKEAQQRAIDSALLAAKELNAQALQAANERFAAFVAATDKRFESVNEFRGTLSDQATTLLPRAEYESNRRNETTDGFAGRAGGKQTLAVIASIGFGLLGLGFGVVTFLAQQ